MVEHLAGFFADFGVTATLPSTAVVRGIFDASYQDVLGVSNDGPAFTVGTADVASLDHGDTITIGASAYTVRAIEPDGTGMTVLRLERQ